MKRRKSKSPWFRRGPNSPFNDAHRCNPYHRLATLEADQHRIAGLGSNGFDESNYRKALWEYFRRCQRG